METDAKGQLGGLDMGEQGRRKLAETSAAWKCKDCGRSNGEILEECAKAAAELGGETQEEVVPEGLVIGTKNDMEKAKAEREASRSDAAPITIPASPYPPARPAQSVPAPTATVQTQQAPPPNFGVQQNAIAARQQVSTDGVPLWVDRAIGAVIICIVALVMKMLIGL
jgi:ubiquitin-conjugating enzyme E2 J1